MSKMKISKPAMEKAKEKENIHKKKRRKAAIFLSALGALGVLSYCGADFHYNNKIDARYERFIKDARKPEMEQKPFDMKKGGLSRKMKYISRLESMENNVKKYHGEFLDFLNNNEDSLIELTDSKTEIHGYIEKIGGGFEIKRKTGIRDKIIDHVSDVLNGNYSHKGELLKYYDLSPVLFLGIEKKEMLSNILLMMEFYEKHAKMPKAGTGVILYDASGKPTQMQWEDLEKVYQSGKKMFEILLKVYEMWSVTQIDKEFLDTDIFSRFHTHPLDDPNYSPSNTDILGTYIAGPNTLFSRTGGVLRVYEIAEGESREIYTKKLEHRKDSRSGTFKP